MDNFLNITRWNVRLTTEKELPEIEAMIQTICQKYIIGTELSTKGKLHYHCYLEGQIKDKQSLKVVFNENGYNGNAMWYAKEADNSSKVKKYCVKYGRFVYKNIDSQLMETWVKLSHGKAKDGMSEDLNNLEDTYMSTTMTREKLGKQYLLICAKYNYKQGITRSNFNKYINYMNLRKDPDRYSEYLVSLWKD